MLLMKMKIKCSLGVLPILVVILVDTVLTQSLHEVVNNGKSIQNMRELKQNPGKGLKKL
jgi:hypothetical protein